MAGQGSNSTQTQAIFSALDNAKTQLYHVMAIVIAGMGFCTDAYDVMKLIGSLYFPNPTGKEPEGLPKQLNNAITGVALCGTLAGQLFFGWLGDKLSRKKVYGLTLVTIVGCALASGLYFGHSAKHVITTLCFFRFWLGFGIGGDYPLSAVIMAEYANQKTRGGFIAAVFAMQGVGILVAGAVAMVVSKAFLVALPAPEFQTDTVLSTQPEGDYVWRIVLMFGAIPAVLTYYWRLKMPETARYTALVEGDHKRAAANVAEVLEKDLNFDQGDHISSVQTKKSSVSSPNSFCGFCSREFVRRHGLHLLGTTTTWFLLDIAFYSLQLTQKDVYPDSGMLRKASTMNAIEEVFQLSTAILGFKYESLRGDQCGDKNPRRDFCNGNTLFSVFYGLTFFFSNFGPNSTTFIVPVELFSARFRSQCHGISAAAGKAGAIIGAFVVQSYTAEVKDVRKAIVALSVENLFGFLFTFLVPETKNGSPEEISGEDKGIALIRLQKLKIWFSILVS